jgi:hypothetical protein
MKYTKQVGEEEVSASVVWLSFAATASRLLVVLT